jgi:small-conductance mechanosensitive channel
MADFNDFLSLPQPKFRLGQMLHTYPHQVSSGAMNRLRTFISSWAGEWLDLALPAAHIALILLFAFLLNYSLRKLISRSARGYAWPLELEVPIKGLVRWLIISASVLMILEVLGVSAAVLWTAFSGFAAVGAVAFFAAWSVLSNFFCALLIMTVRPYRLGDTIEVLEALDKTGVKGRVIDINMLYTTLEEHHSAEGGHRLVQIPNIFVFQKGLRRWAALPQPAPAAPPAEAKIDTTTTQG